MGRKTKIAIVVGVAALVLGAVGAYAYDDSRKDRIADGVTIGGVDVGGMTATEAEQAVRSQLLDPLRHPLKVGYAGHSWKLPVKQLKVHAEVSAAVQRALDESRDGWLPGRIVRYVTGGEVDLRVPADVSYSQQAVNRFVRRIATAVDREPQNADVEPTGDSLTVVGAENGRKLRDNRLTHEIDEAVLNADADRTIAAAHPRDPARSDAQRSRRRVPLLPDPRPFDLPAAPLEAPQAGEDVHGRGRHGRAGNPGRALPHPGKGRKPFLARPRLGLGRATSPGR